jgi:hypothetical protein
VYPDVHTPLTSAVGLHLTGNTLRVMFEGPYPYESELPPVFDALMGAPSRRVPRCPFALQVGEWGHIRYVGRLPAGWDGVTYYQKWVYNIGWFSSVSPRAFLANAPHHRYENMPDVW